LPSLLTISHGGNELSSRAAMVHEGTLRRQAPLGRSGRLPSLHSPLAYRWEVGWIDATGETLTSAAARAALRFSLNRLCEKRSRTSEEDPWRVPWS
jgi:hypothetical protein